MTDQERAALAQQLQGGHAHGDDGHEHRTNPFTDSNTRVLAISSGKGGVGKSSVTTNLAVALAQRGTKVAAIDADVWGFSMPRMLGIDRPPTVIDDVIVPPDANGVTLISMGFFAREDQPVVWRGPMLHKALEQFLTDVHWGEPDYLIVDMPPGTGDIALSMAQFLPRAEVIVVTTPQPAAQKVAQRAAYMARKVNLSVVGVIENMSWFTCDHGTEYRLFGEGGGQELADQLEVPLLGQVPLVPELRAGADNGEPIVVSHPDDPASRVFARDGRAPRRRDGAQAHLPNRAQDRLTARVQRMEVRIGVVYTARELTVETDDSVDGVTAAIDERDLGRRRRACGSPTRRAGASACRSTRSRTSRSRPTRVAARSASARASAHAVVNGPAPELLDRRLLFFTGKGGVGKSTMAAATALLASSIGKRVLLVEVDAKGDIPAQFEHAPVGFTPKEIHPGVLAMAMDTEASLQEYLRLNLRVPVIGRIGPLARVLDFVATAAPGVKEILTIGKIAWEVRESIEGRADFDLVVVDAAATGHIVAQLGAADAIRELVDVGPLRSQTQWVSELLADPGDHRGQRRHDARGDAGRGDDRARRPHPARGQRAARERHRQPGAARAVHPRRRGDVRSAARAAAARRADRARRPGRDRRARRGPARGVAAAHAARRTSSYLRQSVDLPLLYVPYLFVRAHGLRVTRMVADALGAELGL